MQICIREKSEKSLLGKTIARVGKFGRQSHGAGESGTTSTKS